MTTKGSMNHIRLCVSELARSSGFYSTVLSYLGYQLMKKTDTVQGWARPGPRPQSAMDRRDASRTGTRGHHI